MSDREQFKYFDGISEVYGDPLRIQDDLTESLDGDPYAVYKRMVQEDEPGVNNEPVRIQARRKMEEAVRSAFHMAPFDPQTGSGADMKDCVNAWSALFKFGEQKKKNADGMQT